jgi:hypothetical protein
MSRRCWPILGLVALLALVACGGSPATATLVPTTAPTPTINVAPTQTRAAELSQIATLTAPTATLIPPTMTPTALIPTATTAIPTLVPTAAATPDSALGKGSFVGRIDQSEAFVAIVVTGDDVMAYVCDGNNLARWFKGTRQGATVDLRGEGGERLTANLGPAPANGSLRQSAGTFTAANGQALRFNSTATTGLDKGGLYRGTGNVDGADAVLGVIVLPNGEFRGAFWVQEKAYGVTSPTIGTGSLTATYGGSVQITAQRLGTP